MNIFDVVESGEVHTLFLDFDNTICIHPYGGVNSYEVRDRFFKCLNSDMYYVQEAAKGTFKVLPGMYELVSICTEKGIKVYGLSFSECSIYLRAKKRFLESFFPSKAFKDLIGVYSDEEKAKFISMYKSSVVGPREIILFVDDESKNRKLVNNIENCLVYSPMNVTVGFEMFRRRSNER